jgi:hypothetical protein
MKNARRSEAGVIQRAGGLFTTYDSRTSCKTQLLVGPRFARQIKRVHALGPRPLAELLDEIATATGQPALVADHVEKYSQLDPAALRAVGGDRFPPSVLGAVR